MSLLETGSLLTVKPSGCGQMKLNIPYWERDSSSILLLAIINCKQVKQKAYLISYHQVHINCSKLLQVIIALLGFKFLEIKIVWCFTCKHYAINIAGKFFRVIYMLHWYLVLEICFPLEDLTVRKFHCFLQALVFRCFYTCFSVPEHTLHIYIYDK